MNIEECIAELLRFINVLMDKMDDLVEHVNKLTERVNKLSEDS